MYVYTIYLLCGARDGVDGTSFGRVLAKEKRKGVEGEGAIRVRHRALHEGVHPCQRM